MSAGTTVTNSAAFPPAGASRWSRRCWLAALAAGWLWTWNHLSLEWRFNQEYQYGFAVPFLSAYLGWRRWLVFAPPSGLRAPAASWGLRLLLLACWLLFAAGEILREHDPGWRLCGGAMMTAVSAASLAWFYLRAGWPLVRQMLFPVAFAWLALPWPSDAERFLVDELTRRLTSAVIFALNFASIPAFQHGNVIATARGYVGIDDACSGVQSFQSSLMAALFLGEWFGLPRARRAGLVVGGWVIAWLGNFGRVLALTLVVSHRGDAAIPAWHDPLGYASTGLIFLGLFLLAWLQAPRRAAPEHSTTSGPASPGSAPDLPGGAEGPALAAGGLLVPLLAFLWFHELVAARVMRPQTAPLWAILTNQAGADWIPRPILLTPAEKSMLRYSEGEGWTFRSREGWDAQVFHFFWKPGEGYPSMTYVHTPNVCMPSAGWGLDGPPEPVELRVHGAIIRGGLYRFSQRQLRELVFQTISYDGKTMPTFEDPYASGTRSDRFAMLWRKPRQQIGEEMMVMIPSSDAGRLDVAVVGKLLETFLDPVRLKTPGRAGRP